MKIVIIALIMSFPALAVASQDIVATHENGSVVLRMREGNDERVFVVTQVLQVGGQRAPNEYQAPFRLDRMIQAPQEDEDFSEFSGCMPRGLVRGVLNWFSDYVMNELERLLRF